MRQIAQLYTGNWTCLFLGDVSPPIKEVSGLLESILWHEASDLSRPQKAQMFESSLEHLSTGGGGPSVLTGALCCQETLDWFRRNDNTRSQAEYMVGAVGLPGGSWRR
ncbi:unnamed protein product [Pleuronectes platessa]|uniref:Uncharacterized protein n=1 Tax=Pleuronectes platessa TaxID=8262 RepID=A0A9N7V6K3_PLEPL|nr:unnamed protein product [Pleuronectes platessa]